jgi:hypothetical protein
MGGGGVRDSGQRTVVIGPRDWGIPPEDLGDLACGEELARFYFEFWRVGEHEREVRLVRGCLGIFLGKAILNPLWEQQCFKIRSLLKFRWCQIR